MIQRLKTLKGIMQAKKNMTTVNSMLTTCLRDLKTAVDSVTTLKKKIQSNPSKKVNVAINIQIS